MAGMREIDFVFFDIGGTLGERDAATGRLVAFPSSARLLRMMREAVGVRVGVITTLGPGLTNEDGKTLLRRAGLEEFIDPELFISDHDAGVAKPDAEIYRLAATRAGVPVGRCLFVGENLIEVIGALAAGMKAVLKPCPPGRDLPV
ncbi:MAG TPA: HAD-IA family hydrolase [Pyrinomonadaceae bacterium]